MDWRERITATPDTLAGKPRIEGTRIAVELVLGLMAAGWTEEELLRNYPALTQADLRACLAYAAHLAHEERGARLAA